MQADTPARLHHDAPAWLSSRKYPHLVILQFWLFCLRSHYYETSKWYAISTGMGKTGREVGERRGSRAPRASPVSL
jgi:hypothetical protein